MGKLTGSALAYVAENVTAYSKYSVRQIKITTNGSEEGRMVFDFLRNAYKPSHYYYGTTFRDFRLKWDYQWKRDQVFNELDNAITQYRKKLLDASYEPYEEEPYEPEPETQSILSAEEEEGSGKDYTTYIIIGAAALIVTLLLWPRKGK